MVRMRKRLAKKERMGHTEAELSDRELDKHGGKELKEEKLTCEPGRPCCPGGPGSPCGP